MNDKRAGEYKALADNSYRAGLFAEASAIDDLLDERDQLRKALEQATHLMETAYFEQLKGTYWEAVFKEARQMLEE